MADPVLTPRTRRNASLAVRRPRPGRYLALDDGGETVLLRLSAELTRIGRSVTAQIALEDGSASRRHALIVSGPRGAQVVDDGSRNGTFVNGERVTRRALAHGDLIRVGRTSLRYLELPRTPVDEETEELEPPDPSALAAAA
jgi:pSer/pThr/pTyr-binding forkhead associated (FHA) protein